MTHIDPPYFLAALVAAIFFVLGLVMRFFRAKKTNGLYGYRTQRSMLSQERWEFAQRYSAQLFIKAALIYLAGALVFSFLDLVLNTNETVALIYFNWRNAFNGDLHLCKN